MTTSHNYVCRCLHRSFQHVLKVLFARISRTKASSIGMVSILFFRFSYMLLLRSSALNQSPSTLWCVPVCIVWWFSCRAHLSFCAIPAPSLVIHPFPRLPSGSSRSIHLVLPNWHPCQWRFVFCDSKSPFIRKSLPTQQDTVSSHVRL